MEVLAQENSRCKYLIALETPFSYPLGLRARIQQHLRELNPLCKIHDSFILHGSIIAYPLH